jgi:hypothetical protein
VLRWYSYLPTCAVVGVLTWTPWVWKVLQSLYIYIWYTRIATLKQTPCSKMCSVGTALRTFAVIFVKLKWSHFLPGSPELLQKPRSAHRNPQQTLGLPSWFFWSSFSGDNVPGTGCSELVNPLWDPNNGQRNFGDNFIRKFLGWITKLGWLVQFFGTYCSKNWSSCCQHQFLTQLVQFCTGLATGKQNTILSLGSDAGCRKGCCIMQSCSSCGAG